MCPLVGVCCHNLSLKAQQEHGSLTDMKSVLTTAMGLALVCHVAAAAEISKAGREAQSAAGEYRAAVMACDMGWAFDFMYPPIKRTLADRFASRQPGQEGKDARRIMGLERESAEEAEARMTRTLGAVPRASARAREASI